MAEKIKVLFLCRANTDRSQLAEVLLHKIGGPRFEVHSAGSEPGSELELLTRQMIEMQGYDPAKYTPKHYDQFLDDDFDFIITISNDDEQDAPVFPKDNLRIIWHFDDLTSLEVGDARYQRAFRYISNGLETRTRLFVNLWRDGDRRAIIALRTKLLDERLSRMRDMDREHESIFGHEQARASIGLSHLLDLSEGLLGRLQAVRRLSLNRLNLPGSLAYVQEAVAEEGRAAPGGQRRAWPDADPGVANQRLGLVARQPHPGGSLQ